MQMQYSVSQSHQHTSVISNRVCGSVVGVSCGSCSVVNMLTVLVQDLLLLAQTYTHWDVIHNTSHHTQTLGPLLQCTESIIHTLHHQCSQCQTNLSSQPWTCITVFSTNPVHNVLLHWTTGSTITCHATRALQSWSSSRGVAICYVFHIKLNERDHIYL